jgi:putative thiamine transport system permease protein
VKASSGPATLVGGIPLTVLFLLPLVAALLFAFSSAIDGAAWVALFRHPQFFAALELSIATGAVATVASLLLSLFITAGIYESARSEKSLSILGIILAVPHLAVAIALGLLVMPTGLIARLLAIPFSWATPPAWITTHDPFGALLVAALVLKETPFLVYLLLAHLRRDDVALKFSRQAQAARSLGHGSGSIWLRIVIPQLGPVLVWPLLVVFSYAATVVDLSIAIGPTQPSTLSAIIWADLNSSDPTENARGAAGAFALTGAIAITAFLAAAIYRFARPILQGFYAGGPSLMQFPNLASKKIWHSMQTLYVLLLACLVLLSFARQWPFPDLLPALFDWASWSAVIAQPGALLTSILLALGTATSGLAILLCWFETQDRRNDVVLLVFSLSALALPSLVTGLGQYQMLLRFELSGTALGLYLVHLMPVVAYMFLVLALPYRSFDERWKSTSNALQANPARFLLQIKWPLLKPQLLASFAIGFAVSFGQYVPTQLAAAGRFSTLPMEAVALTSGANRPLTAAFALMLALAPAVVFITASILSRPRWAHA